MFAEVKLRAVKNERERWLTAGEIDRLRDASGDWWILAAVSLATGIRRGELFGLRVHDVDLEQHAIVVDSKTPAGERSVPLEGEALGLLSDWIESEELGDREYVFRHLERRFQRAWPQIRLRAGLWDADQAERVVWHDMRHTFAVHAAKAGMPMPELKQRLGHVHLSTTMRYAKYAPAGRDAYRTALGRMGLGSTVMLTLPALQQAAKGE